MRPRLRMGGASCRLDEAHVKVGAGWEYLCRAGDSTGDTVESMPGAGRDVSAAKRSFKELVRAGHRRLPFATGAGRHAPPEASAAPVKEKVLPHGCKLRRVKYLDTAIEQDHRFIRRGWRAMQCLRPFHTAERTLEGVEAAHMMRKGQVRRLGGRDAAGQARFAASLFGVAA